MSSLIAINRGNPHPLGSVSAHPALPVNPTFVDALPPSRPGIAGSLHVLPPVVIDTTWAKRWRVDANLGMPGLSLSDSGELSLPAANFEKRCGPSGWAPGYWQAVEQNFGDEIEVGMSVNVTIGALQGFNTPFPVYDHVAGLWWPSLSANISSGRREYNDEAPPTDSVAYANLGYLGIDEEDGGESGVTVVVAGQSLQMRAVSLPEDDDEDVGTYSLSGTITLTPLEWY
jgi:hypothetical protein